jgi:pimeloyl-ACP methyl ester carboxylesterase
MSDAPVLLIHGVGSSFEHNWRAPGWVDLLAEQGRDVVGVELPGHGAEVARGAPDRDAADLILERAARFAQVDAIGFSADGFALMRAASREPGRFGRIALLAVADSGLGDAAGPGSMTADSIADVLVSDVETEDQMALVIRRLAVVPESEVRVRARRVFAARPLCERVTEFLERDLDVGIVLQQHRHGFGKELDVDVRGVEQHQGACPVEGLGDGGLLLQVE